MRRPEDAGHDVDQQQQAGVRHGEPARFVEVEDVERRHPARAERQAEVGDDDPEHVRSGDHLPVVAQPRRFGRLGRRAFGCAQQGENRSKAGRADDEQSHRADVARAAVAVPLGHQDGQGDGDRGPDHADQLDHPEHPRSLMVVRCDRGGPGGVRQGQQRGADVIDEQPADQISDRNPARRRGTACRPPA